VRIQVLLSTSAVDFLMQTCPWRKSSQVHSEILGLFSLHHAGLAVISPSLQGMPGFGHVTVSACDSAGLQAAHHKDTAQP